MNGTTKTLFSGLGRALRRIAASTALSMVGACAVFAPTSGVPHAESTAASSMLRDDPAFWQRLQIRLARQHLRTGKTDQATAEAEAENDVRAAAVLGSKKARTESARKEYERLVWGHTLQRDWTAYERAKQQRERDVAQGHNRVQQQKVAGVVPAAWQQLNRTAHPSGRVNHLWIDPQNNNRVLAGTDGDGIWKSLDAGVTWTPITTALGVISIEKIVQSPANGQLLYAASGSARGHNYSLFGIGILKSNDGGDSWQRLASTTPSCNPNSAASCADATQQHWGRLYGIDVSINDANIVLVATSNGLWRSGDGGATWAQALAAPFVTTPYTWQPPFSDVQFNPGDGSRALAVTQTGAVYRSADGGLTWAGMTISAIPNSIGARIFHATGVTARAYVLGANAANELEIHRTTDAGASWTFASKVLTPSGSTVRSSLWYTGALWVDPTDENRVVVGSGWVYRTQNGGTSWESFCCGWADPTTLVADPAYNGTTNRRLYLADDGGVYRYNDIAVSQSATSAGSYASVSYLNTGLSVTQNYAVAGVSPGPVVTGNQDVGVQAYPLTTAPNSAWRLSQAGDGTDVAVDPSAPSTLYGTTQYASFIYRNDDGGSTYAQTILCSVWGPNAPPATGTAPCADNGPFYARFALDPAAAQRMYVGARSLWRADDVKNLTTPVWTKILPGQVGETVTGLSVSRANSDHVWLLKRASSAADAVWRTTNARSSTPQFAQAAALPNDCWGGNVIQTERQDVNTAWLGCAGLGVPTLYKTSDAGASWQPVASFPKLPIYAISQHPQRADYLYVGTEFGLYASADNGVSWSASSDGPGNIAVHSIAWYTPTTMLIGTYGRNVWKQTVLASNLAPGCVLDVNADGALTPEADGVLLTRYLLGFRGDALIAGIPLGTARPNATAVASFIGSGQQFDVFGRTLLASGPSALADGLVLLRVLRGVTDNLLLTGINVPSAAQFVTPSAIRANINSKCGTSY